MDHLHSHGSLVRHMLVRHAAMTRLQKHSPEKVRISMMCSR